MTNPFATPSKQPGCLAGCNPANCSITFILLYFSQKPTKLLPKAIVSLNALTARPHTSITVQACAWQKREIFPLKKGKKRKKHRSGWALKG